MNLNYHKEDFGINAEWHFFATAHGKGPCDGVGGTVKRMAARASLQLPIDAQITTSQGLYEWATKPNNLLKIDVIFSPEEDYTEAKKLLEMRYAKAKSITGTQKLHCVIPDGNGTLTVKEFSRSLEHRFCKLFKRQRK